MGYQSLTLIIEWKGMWVQGDSWWKSGEKLNNSVLVNLRIWDHFLGPLSYSNYWNIKAKQLPKLHWNHVLFSESESNYDSARTWLPWVSENLPIIWAIGRLLSSNSIIWGISLFSILNKLPQPAITHPKGIFKGAVLLLYCTYSKEHARMKNPSFQDDTTKSSRPTLLKTRPRNKMLAF